MLCICRLVSDLVNIKANAPTQNSINCLRDPLVKQCTMMLHSSRCCDAHNMDSTNYNCATVYGQNFYVKAFFMTKQFNNLKLFDRTGGFYVAEWLRCWASASK